MPQLPSGRHIALDPSRAGELTDGATKPFLTHKMMAIESVIDLLPYIHVIYFKPATNINDDRPINKFSNPLPEDMEMYDSGYTLANIKAEVDGWSDSDQQAFHEFLCGDALTCLLNDLYKNICDTRDILAQYPPASTAGLMAAWWQAGCHPLQEGNDEQ